MGLTVRKFVAISGGEMNKRWTYVAICAVSMVQVSSAEGGAVPCMSVGVAVGESGRGGVLKVGYTGGEPGCAEVRMVYRRAWQKGGSAAAGGCFDDRCFFNY